MRRLVCRLRGHEWGPWFPIRWWHVGNIVDEYRRRVCRRCQRFEEREVSP